MSIDQTSKNDPRYVAFLWLVAVVGLFVTGVCLLRTPFVTFDWQFWVLTVFALALGSRMAIKIEYTRTSISIIDIFTILLFLRYGTAPAVLLGAVEAYISSGRYSRQPSFRLFNAGTIGVSFFFAFAIAEYTFGSPNAAIAGSLTAENLGRVALVVIVHYLVNTGMVAFASSFRHRKNFFDVWQEHYFWMFVPFLASGSAALISAGMIQSLGFPTFLTMLPILGIIYYSYRSHHEKFEAMTAKAKLTETHLVEMRESEERFRSAFSNAPIGIALISADGKWLQVNEAFCDILGVPEENLLDGSLRDFVHHADLIDFLAETGAVLKGKKPSFHAEMRFVNGAGEDIWTQTSVSPLNDSQNSRLICQVQNITARRIAEEKLRYNAFYDSLTDLANRHLFMDRLQECVGRAENNGEFAVLFVDLDRFKLVNDTVGHSVGDKLLVSVANRLSKCLPADATLARFASDEFLMLIDGVEDRQSVLDIVEEVRLQMGLIFSVAGQELNLTASLGVVFYDREHENAEAVLRDADTALHMAKQKGRNCSVVFDDAMRAAALHDNRLERDLYRAIERRELFLVFQPIVSIGCRKLSGFEALIRWKHPEFGIVSPVEFIPIAEENGMIVEIGNFVLDEACRQLREWDKSMGRDMQCFVAINVSSRQLLQKGLLDEVIGALDRHQIKPHRLKLEITESVVVDNSDYVLSILKQFRAMGVKLSMDDFGTGYSSLSYLHQLPIDTLKIDRSFVSNAHLTDSNAEIIKTILLLAKTLRLETVAEGIETLEQLEFLTESGCDLAQGYYFSKPLEVEKAFDFMLRSEADFGGASTALIDAQAAHFQN